MTTKRRVNENPVRYRVCGGKFYVNEDPIQLNHRILKIGAVAAGLDATDPCGTLSEGQARLILHMERSWLLAGLARELRGGNPGRAA